MSTEPNEKRIRLFWGTVVSGGERDAVVHFFHDEQVALQLGALPYHTYPLEGGGLCLGITLQAGPPVRDLPGTAAQKLWDVLVEGVPQQWLVQACQLYQNLRQIASASGIHLTEGELLYEIAAEKGGAASCGVVLDPSSEVCPRLFHCLSSLEECGVSLLAVQVPDAWKLNPPYWTPHLLQEELDATFQEVHPQVPLGSYAYAPAYTVLVQDAGAGVFAQIHYRGVEVGAAPSTLPVVNLLTHAGVRTLMREQLEQSEQAVRRYTEEWKPSDQGIPGCSPE